MFIKINPANLLLSLMVSFGQDRFVNELKTVVARKQKMKLLINEGWYSEGEMRDDLGWSANLGLDIA